MENLTNRELYTEDQDELLQMEKDAEAMVPDMDDIEFTEGDVDEECVNYCDLRNENEGIQTNGGTSLA